MESMSHLSVPASIVMHVNDAARAGSQASLDKRVVLLEVVLVERTSEHVVGEELPADGETEDVETVVVDKVLHLSSAIMTVVLEQRRPRAAGRARAVGVAAKVEAGNVHTCETQRTGARRRTTRGRGGAGGRAYACSCACRRRGARDALGVIWVTP